MADKKICGAKTRSGGVCHHKPMKNGRCRFHGGKSTGAPKGNQNARKHGAYSRFFTEEEKNQLDEIELDNIDSELQLCKIQLLRALEAQEKQLQSTETDKLELIAQTMQAVKDGDDLSRQQINKSFAKTDFGFIIDRLIGRIQSLTQTRMDMMSKSIDIELKQHELAKIQDAGEKQKAQPIQVVIDVVDGRKDAETKQETS